MCVQRRPQGENSHIHPSSDLCGRPLTLSTQQALWLPLPFQGSALSSLPLTCDTPKPSPAFDTWGGVTVPTSTWYPGPDSQFLLKGPEGSEGGRQALPSPFLPSAGLPAVSTPLAPQGPLMTLPGGAEIPGRHLPEVSGSSSSS